MRDSKTPSPLPAASVLLALVLAGVLLARPLQLPLPAVGFVLALLALRLGVMASAIGGAPAAPPSGAPAAGLSRRDPHPTHA
jgi:hypothetical protein